MENVKDFNTSDDADDNGRRNRFWQRPVFRQIFYSSSSLLNMFTTGLILGFPALIIPHIKNKDSDLHASSDFISWFVAAPGMLSFAITIMVGALMNSWGRKKTHLLITSCSLIGWILAASSFTIYPLFLARIFQGILYGGIRFIGICIAELTEPHMRGVLLALKLMAVSLGTTTAHAFGYFIDWRCVAYIGIAASLTSLTINFFWTESPEWLLQKKKINEAREAFFKLRDKKFDSEDEFTKMLANQQLKQNSKAKTNVFRTIISRPFLKVALLTICKQTIIEFGGRHYFPAYLIENISNLTGNSDKSFIYVISLDCISIIAGLFSCILIKNFTRRSLLINVGVAAMLILLTFCATLFLNDNYFHVNLLLYLSLGLLGLYILIMYGAVFSVTMVLSGELWPIDFRHIGVVFHSIVATLFFTIWMKIVPFLTLHLHVHGLFTLCSIFILAVLFYMYKRLPETTGRTLHDISVFFEGNPKELCQKDKDETRRIYVE